jgi:3-deoxy-D-manno-octulosonic-acid transferase
LVAGSTWQPEEDLLLPLLMRFPELKVILAPHAISRIDAIDERLPVPRIRWSRYAESSPEAKEEARVLLVDTIGDLPALYACGNLALVGGAFGPGLHNILEALAHGLPVACGPKIEGHWEASHPDAPVTLLPEKAQVEDLDAWIRARLEKPSLLESERTQAKAFVAQHRGASQRVWDVLCGRGIG